MSQIFDKHSLLEVLMGIEISILVPTWIWGLIQIPGDADGGAKHNTWPVYSDRASTVSEQSIIYSIIYPLLV